MEFDFGSYNEIKNAINKEAIMQYTLVGGQGVACTWIIIKFIHDFMKDTFEGQNKMTNMINSFSLIFFVIIAPYVMDILDDTFANVEGIIEGFQGGRLSKSIKDTLICTIHSTMEDVKNNSLLDWVVTIMDVGLEDLMTSLLNLILGIVGFLLWALDMAIFSIFYIERLLIIELYRFIFPIFIAFIGFEGLRSHYYKWVVSFIGILLLPIPYIAVHRVMDTISELIINKNKSDYQAVNVVVMIVVLIITIGMKYKILSKIGSSVSKILS